MPLDEGGGRGKSKPVFKKPPKLPPKKGTGNAPRPDALRFGADVGLFTPPALVTPVAPVRGERDKVPVPFPIKPTAQQVRVEREKQQKAKDAQRTRDAVVAPVSDAARRRVRRGETRAERDIRTKQPKPERGLLGKLADTRGLIGLGEKTGAAAKDLSVGVTRAALEGLISKAYEVQNRPGPFPTEAVAALEGAKAGLTPAVYMTVGPDLMNSVVGLEYSRAGRAFDLAVLPLGAGVRPFKAARAAGAAAKAAGKGRKLEDIADIAGEAYSSRSIAAARRASNAHKELVDAAVKQRALSAPHGRALKAQVAAEQALEDAKVAVATANAKGKAAAEEALEKAKEARKAAKQEELYTRLRATADYKPLTPEDPGYAARDQLAKQLYTTLKKRQGALPPGATVKSIRDNMTFLEEMADRGEAGRLWYENSAEAILRMAQGDADKAEKFAQLLAIYSPQQPILGNTSLAIRAWNEFQQAAGDFDTLGRVETGQAWQKKAATKVMQGAGDWEGRKTNNFYVNFLEDINKPKFDDLVAKGQIRPDGVTVDLWMARVFGYPVDNVSEGRYDFVEPITRLLADERGWKPKQMQAAIWTAIKDESDDVSANIDFATGIARHYGQFNYEAAPGVESTFGAIYRSWPPELQQQFAEANTHLVDDFLKEAGFLAEESRLGAGVFDGPNGLEFNPGASARVATSAPPRDIGVGYTVHPTEREALTKAAAAIGAALEQDSVAWVRPIVARSRGHADTVAAQLGRAVTWEEAQILTRALEGRGVVMTANEGVIIRKIDPDLPNISRKKSEQGFDDLVRQAVDEAFPGDVEVGLRYHASDGELVESSSYGAHLGKPGDGSGSGAELRFAEAADRLARDAAELRSRFSTLAEPVGAGAAGDVVPEVRRAQLETFLKPYLASVEGASDPAAARRLLAEAAAGSDAPIARRVTAALDEMDQIEAAEVAAAKADFLETPGAYRIAETRAAGGWLDAIKQLVAAESAALSALPVAGIDDPLQLGAASVGGVAALEAGRRGLARSAARSLDAPYKTRRLTTGGVSQQLPRARSEISQFGTRVIDRMSESLDKTVIKDVPGLRIVTAHARVPKAAGRVSRQEAIRRPARVRGALNTVSHLKEGTMEDVAHFWYAQLPASHRNADGLRLIRDLQAEELQRLTSGEALDDLKDRATAIQIAMGEAETGSQIGALKNDLEEVQKLMADYEQRSIDVAASVNQMEKLIAHAPEVDEEVIDALRVLAQDRKQVLIDTGRLDPERAANRESLVGSWLGLEPDGTEVYVGHRLPPGVEVSPRVAAVSAGTGRVASPKGVGTRNRMVLATTGRVRPSTHVALEDWSASQVFLQATEARDFLGRLGAPFQNRFKEGYTLINPKGRTVPAHWKTDELAAFSEGADDVTETRELAQDLISTYASANKADMQRIVDEAAEMGVHWSELRLVPNYQVERYYKQFRSFAGRSTPAVAYDMMVDAAATSIVFARIGYIPKNTVQNLIMAIPHQGIMLPANAARAAQVIADPELRFLFQGEIGASGASKAIGNERATKGVTKWALGKIAHFNGSIADDPARMSAFLHEAAAEGVIQRRHFLLTTKDRENLRRLLTDPKQRERLNDIRSRSVEAMADFSRLTPDQARMARRFLIIPGWLMAGSRYPFHFAGTHPIRSALIAYVLLGEPGAPEELQFNQRVDKYFSGSDYLRGIDTPWGRERTSSLNPIGTPWELGLGVKGSIEGREGPFDFDTPTMFDVANPFGATAIDFARGELGGMAGLERAGKRLLPGTFALGKDLIAPPELPPTYPEDVSRLGRLKREIGILPIEVNDSDEDEGGSSKKTKRPGSRSGRAARPGSRSRAPRP